MSRHNVFLSSKYFNLCFFNAKNSVNQSAIIKTRILTLRQHYYLISRFYSNLSMIPIMSFRMRENPRSCFAFHCFRILAKVDFRNLCLLLLFLNDSLPLLTCNHFLFFFYSLSWFFLRSWSFVSLCWHFFLAWRTSLGIFSEKFCLQWIIFFFLHLKLTFIFPSFLKDIFTSYRVLGWQSFFPTLQLSPVH